MWRRKGWYSLEMKVEESYCCEKENEKRKERNGETSIGFAVIEEICGFLLTSFPFPCPGDSAENLVRR